MEISNPLHSGRWFGWVPLTLRLLSVICVACSHVLQFQSSTILSENLKDLVAYNPRDAAVESWQCNMVDCVEEAPSVD